MEGEVVGQVVRQRDQVATFLHRGLQLLRHVGYLLADLMDMVHIQGEAADLDGARGDGNDSHDGAQQRCLACSALTGDTYKLASVYGEIEAAE